MTGAAQRDAHAFLLALSDAIDAEVADGPGRAWTYRGADLGPAVARALFVALSNDAELAAARGGARPSRLEARVAARVLDEPVPGPTPVARLRRAVAAERVLRRARRRGPGPAATAPRPGGVWFLLGHPKFLALVRPVAAALGQSPPAVLWTSADVRPPDHAGDPALDELGLDVTPSQRHAGAEARALPDLLGEFDRIAAALAALRPGGLVVCEGNAPHDALAAAAARRAGIGVTCLQQGWSPVIHTGFRAMPYDRLCVWGHGFAELLAPANPGLDLAVTGSPALEAARATGALAERLAGRAAAGFFLQPRSPYIEAAHQHGLARLAADVARAVPEAALVVRPHPGYPHQAADVDWPENVVFAGADAYGLREVLEAVRAVVSIYSTSLLEGAALGRPAISLNATALPRLLPDLEALGAGRETGDAAVAADAIVALLSDPGAVDPFADGLEVVRDRYFDGVQGDAAARAAAAILM